MISTLVIVVFGWPAIISSMVAALIGIGSRRPIWLSAAALLSLGPAYYFGATPRFSGFGFLFPFLFLAAGWAVRRRRVALASLLAAPFCVVAGWLAWAMLSQ